MQKTLIIRYSQIGDVLIAIPVIYSLAKQYPDDEFTILTNDKFKGIFEQLPRNVKLYPMIYRKKNHPLRGLIYLFDRYKLLLKFLFPTHFDKVAFLQRGTFENQLNTVFSIKKSKIASIELKDFLSKDKLIKKNYFNTPSLNQLYIKTLESLGYSGLRNEFNSGFYKNAPIQPTILGQLNISDNNISLIGLAPFSRLQAKMYPLDQMEKIISYFNSRENVRLLIFGGGPTEEEKTKEWTQKYPNIISMIGKCSFDDELVVIAHCRLIISMDSANLHMASLVNTPAVSIWGPSHPGLGYYPYNQSVENVVQLNDLYCRPCSFWGENPCSNPKQFACMDISPDIIIRRIENLLK